MQGQNQSKKQDIIRIFFIVIGVAVIFTIIVSLIFLDYYSKKLSELMPLTKKEITEELPKVTVPKILYNLTGSVQKLNSGSFLFEATIFQPYEKEQPSKITEMRKVLVTPVTKFCRLTFVVQEGTNTKTPQETPLKFQDLKLGDYVEVISNQDISQAEEFEATQVRILQKSF